MRYRLSLSLIILLLVLTSFHCQNALEKRKELKNCDFMIRKVGTEAVGLTSLTLKLDLTIYNPNRIDVIMDKLDIDLWINDNFVGRGFNRDKITIKSTEHKLCPISAHIKYSGAYKAIRDIIKALRKDKDLNYRIQGKVYFQTIFGDISFPFESSSEPER